MLSFVSTIGLFFIVFIIEEHIGVDAKPRAVATAPLKEVKEGSILSLHCQIFNSGAEHRASISHTSSSGVSQKIAFGKNILSELPNNKNYFLAHRKLTDGSDVYFLSVTEVRRSDAGNYTCYLLGPEFKVITSDTVHIGVKYFPSESFPVCDPNGPQEILEGDTMTLNCNSEAGNPPVNMHWTRSGNVEDPLQAEVINGSVGVYSQVSFQARMSDKDAMFFCKIESDNFPTKSDQKCSVGPLNVIPNPDMQFTTIANYVQVTQPKYTLVNTSSSTNVNNNNYNNNNDDECHEVCAEMTAESVFRWTIATVIAGLLALLFFVFGIVLLIRYCFALDEQRVPPAPQEEMHDMPDMSNVQYRIDGSRLYMTLERPSTSQTEAVYQGGEVLERQYILAPSRAGEFDHVDGSYLGTPYLRDVDHPYQRTPIRRDSYTQSTDSPVKCIELEPESMDTTVMSDDIDRPSYHGTPMHNGGASISLQGTPTHRVLMDKVLLEAQSEGFIGTPPRRESDGYIGGPSRGESDRILFGTPTRGDYQGQRCLTPTLPPRRYKTHYV